MNIIDRYIYTVVKRLPENERQEVELSLRESIEDMLPDDYTESDVEKTLIAMGNPVELAGKYGTAPRGLISPQIYNSYIAVLKIVLTVVVCVAPLITFLSTLTAPAEKSNLDLFIDFIAGTLAFVFNAGLQAFAWVTIVFAINDRFGGNWLRWPYTGKEWTLSDLEKELPAKEKEIAKSDPILSIIFSMIFAIMIVFFPHLLGAYAKFDGAWQVFPLFDLDALHRFLPFLILGIGLNIIVAIVKLIYQRWNRPIAIVNALANLVTIGILVFFIMNTNIVSDQFSRVIGEIMPIHHQEQVSEIIRRLVLGVLSAAILFGSIWDSINGFRKAAK